MFLDEIFITYPLLTGLVIAWVLPWKGYALWKAARKSQNVWFIVLLLVNTLAILEILYIFIFSEMDKKKKLRKKSKVKNVRSRKRKK